MNQGKASWRCYTQQLSVEKGALCRVLCLIRPLLSFKGMEIRYRRLRARTKPCCLLEAPGKLNANSKNLDKAVLYHKRKDGAWHGKVRVRRVNRPVG